MAVFVVLGWFPSIAKVHSFNALLRRNTSLDKKYFGVPHLAIKYKVFGPHNATSSSLSNSAFYNKPTLIKTNVLIVADLKPLTLPTDYKGGSNQQVYMEMGRTRLLNVLWRTNCEIWLSKEGKLTRLSAERDKLEVEWDTWTKKRTHSDRKFATKTN